MTLNVIYVCGRDSFEEYFAERFGWGGSGHSAKYKEAEVRGRCCLRSSAASEPSIKVWPQICLPSRVAAVRLAGSQAFGHGFAGGAQGHCYSAAGRNLWRALVAISQRTRETGIRLTLGTTPANMMRMVLGEAMKVCGGPLRTTQQTFTYVARTPPGERRSPHGLHPHPRWRLCCRPCVVPVLR
jgi:hypothetical protein